MALGAVPVYLLARDRLENGWLGVVVAACFLLYPSLEWIWLGGTSTPTPWSSRRCCSPGGWRPAVAGAGTRSRSGSRWPARRTPPWP